MKLFKQAKPIQIRPSLSLLTEYMRNGWSSDELSYIQGLDKSPVDVRDKLKASRMNIYRFGLGYRFDWGMWLKNTSPGGQKRRLERNLALQLGRNFRQGTSPWNELSSVEQLVREILPPASYAVLASRSEAGWRSIGI